jgi:low temperature requirement protein LtrA
LTSRAIVSPEDQSVTFVELFFDLVFVFSVTQVVGILHRGPEWLDVVRALLVFWLIWWAWTQFTWTLNAADTTHPPIQLAVLTATAVAFFMAIATPDAFEGRELWFAIPYVVVRAIGLGLNAWVSWEDPSSRAAVGIFAAASIGGLAAVIGGAAMGGSQQYMFWGLAILLDVVAAGIGGRLEGWNIHPDHFTERHGLFVIIALGESLIVTAGGVTGAAASGVRMTVAALAVAIACGFWWTYFARAKGVLDRALESARGAYRSCLARDAYSLGHFPVLCGVVAYAVAIEEATTNARAPLPFAHRVALAAGVLLFVGGLAVPLRRATGALPWVRVLSSAATAVAIVAAGGIAPVTALAMVLICVAAVAVLERRP